MADQTAKNNQSLVDSVRNMASDLSKGPDPATVAKDVAKSSTMQKIESNPVVKFIFGSDGYGGDGHTTSGLDAAMQKHADQQHPVK